MNTSIKSNIHSDLTLEHRTFNKLGIALSLICAVHCFLTPVIFVLMPWMSGYIKNDVFHVLMLGMVLVVAIMSSIKSRGIKNSNLRLMYFGLLFLVMGVFAHFEHSAHGETHRIYHLLIENGLTATGGIFLAISHYKRLKNCRCSHA